MPRGQRAGHQPGLRDLRPAALLRRAGGGGQGGAGAPSTTWTAGTVDDGRTAYAGVDNAEGSLGLYYFCDRQGRSQLMAAGYQGGAVAMTVEAADERYALDFVPGPNGLYADLPPGHPLLSALGRGRSVRLTGYGGGSLELPLTGSSRAFSQAMARCR